MLNTAIYIAIGCAFAALAYGWLTANWILARPTGNDRMREDPSRTGPQWSRRLRESSAFTPRYPRGL